jgi:branched-chain amino acid transport system permease protein
LFFKLAIFVIGAGLAAIAGSFFAGYVTFVDPSTFTLTESIFILSVIILGGLANLQGSIIGAVILILLPEALRFVGMPDSVAAQMRQLIYGLILVVLMLFRPQGIKGEYKM